jgi:predicted TIM-barrel fold metal-dependent hydrolase
MPLESPTVRASQTSALEGLTIVDSDVHPLTAHRLPDYLSARWREYLAIYGRRNLGTRGVAPAQRPFASRLDASPPDGGPPGSDPGFAAEQLLDEYGISFGLLNPLDPIAIGNAPVQFEIEIARASNDIVHDLWLEDDPRWVAAINIPQEHPLEAVAEIERCLARSDRFIQVLFGSRTERPLGNPKYWPIFEVAEAAGIPVASHVGLSKYHYLSGVGPPTYYYEAHSGYPMAGQTVVPSMIFEGVFNRFPRLKVVLAELGWEWAVPYSWRLDATWKVQRSEVPDVDREPSSYFRDHFWFTSQPSVEPEQPHEIYKLLDQFEAAGFGDKLLFATDYPHWDMDPPLETVPKSLTRDAKQRLLAGNAAALYGLDLDAARAGRR